MIGRRLPLVVALALSTAGVVVVGSDSPVVLTAEFAQVVPAATPYAPSVARTTESWFCPGVPASGDGESGQVVIANPTAEPISGRYTLFNPDGDAVGQPFDVAAYTKTTIEVTDMLSASFVSAMVEVDGGRAVVEQRAVTADGAAIAPCSDQPSDGWYFADGFTIGSADAHSEEYLVITNPFPGRAIVDIGFAVADGPRSPTVFQGYVIPARGMRVIDLYEAGVKDESLLAVSVEVTSGRVVAGRSQHFTSGGRLGYTMTLGAPSLDDQWWFADGETADGVSETYVVYNPTEDDVDVDLVFLGLELDAADPLEPVTLNVPAESVVSFDVDSLGLPAGRHGAIVSTLTTDSIVVERVLTRPAGSESIATTVQIGSQSAYVSTRWHVPVSVDLPLEESLVVLNVSGADGTITVNAIGPGGEQPVPGLRKVALAANGIVAIDLTDTSVVGRHLVVQTDVPVVVERRPARSPDLRGRSSALGLPEF